MTRDVILVGDEQTEHTAHLRAELRGLGYHVVTATDSAQALAHVRAGLPDAVIIDLTAPHIDGLAVCRCLRLDPVTTAAPIIAVAADADTRRAALEAGADEALACPLDGSALRAHIGAAPSDDSERGAPPLRFSTSPQAKVVGVADLLAHDLQSPLSIIIGALELLIHADELADPDAVSRLMERALEAAHRQMQMIDELIDLARLEVGALEWNAEAVSLVQVVEDALDQAANAITERMLEVVDRVPDNLPLVNADAALLRRVLLSLIDNTLKFSLPNTTLTIEATGPGGAGRREVCTLTLTDRGRAVSPRYASVIFEQAIQWRARLDNSRTSVALGFPFCRAAVRLMGGDISVRSSDDAARTTFTITLPVYRSPGSFSLA